VPGVSGGVACLLQAPRASVQWVVQRVAAGSVGGLPRARREFSDTGRGDGRSRRRSYRRRRRCCKLLPVFSTAGLIWIVARSLNLDLPIVPLAYIGCDAARLFERGEYDGFFSITFIITLQFGPTGTFGALMARTPELMGIGARITVSLGISAQDTTQVESSRGRGPPQMRKGKRFFISSARS